MMPQYATGYQVKDSNGVRLLDVGKDYHFALVTTDDAVVPNGYLINNWCNDWLFSQCDYRCAEVLGT